MREKNIKQKHLDLTQREHIETSLNNNQKIVEIAEALLKDPTTISKEIRRNRVYKEPSKHGGYSNICVNRFSCTKTNVCGKEDCYEQCSRCSICNKSCNLFMPELCNNLTRAPHVCNGCDKKSSCRLEKFYYRAKEAQNEYESLKTASREGINLTETQLKNLNELMSPLINKGQPVNHIYAAHESEIPCAISTFYNYVEKGIVSVKSIDLRRKVKYKKRKKKKSVTLRKNAKLLVGRKYPDFLNYIALNPEVNIVEMDLVEGIKGGKVLLTLFFRNAKIMLMYLLNDKTQESVLTVFNEIELKIGVDNFIKTFPIILTDNGTEFSDPISLESSIYENMKRTFIYYCDPNSSWQKGGLEKNHEFIRYVIPKGNTLDKFTQEQMNLLMNHINSTARKELNNSTPMDLSNILLDNTVIQKLGLKKILADDVLLTPKLLQDKNGI